MKYQDINAKTIDSWIEEGWQWGKPIDHQTYINAIKGCWDVLLTPTKYVPHHWFGELEGKCKYLTQLDNIPDNKDVIKIWLMQECK